MASLGTVISVLDDIGVLRDALVQGPVCNPLGGSAGVEESETHEVARQHGLLVRELETAGVTVRHLDALLYSALGFADARDWILERRICEREHDRGRAFDVMSWLSEQPPETLTRYLMEGMQNAKLPSAFNRSACEAAGNDLWFMAPICDVMHARGQFRIIDDGVVLSPPKQQQSRAAAITAATILNFAPLFDQSRFEFWLTADGADGSCPAVDGHDIAIPGEGVYVCAITRNTSVQALSLLAASLFRQNKAGIMFWLDLTGSECVCLDDCFLPLSRECLLIDRELLELASSFVVRANHRGAVLGIEPCKSSFVEELAQSMGSTNLCLIDVKQYQQPVASALATLAPIVLSPGRIIAFEEHEAAFPLLAQHGVEIVSVLPGSALSLRGKGPRGLVTALRVE